MNQNITKQDFRYWVNEVDSSYGTDGGEKRSVFMFGRSFSDDTDYIEWDAPAGHLLAIGREGRLVLDLYLSPAHVSGRGEVVSVIGWRGTMKAPFLLTNALNTVVIANRTVDLVPSPDAETIFDRDARGAAYPVIADNWFGILIREASGLLHLLAFGTGDTACVKRGDAVAFAEWEFECGVIGDPSSEPNR